MRNLPVAGASGPLDAARKARAVWVKVRFAIALMAGGVVGLWMIPLSLALLALDPPFLRGPLARLLTFINHKLTRPAS